MKKYEKYCREVLSCKKSNKKLRKERMRVKKFRQMLHKVMQEQQELEDLAMEEYFRVQQ